MPPLRLRQVGLEVHLLPLTGVEELVAQDAVEAAQIQTRGELGGEAGHFRKVLDPELVPGEVIVGDIGKVLLEAIVRSLHGQ